MEPSIRQNIEEPLFGWKIPASPAQEQFDTQPSKCVSFVASNYKAETGFEMKRMHSK